MKLGCWGPVVKCNVPKRGWINGVGGCPNVGGICIGCTMPGFPDKFMPFMDEPPGAMVSSTFASGWGSIIRSLRGYTHGKLKKSPNGAIADASPRPATSPLTKRAEKLAVAAAARGTFVWLFRICLVRRPKAEARAWLRCRGIPSRESSAV